MSVIKVIKSLNCKIIKPEIIKSSKIQHFKRTTAE